MTVVDQQQGPQQDEQERQHRRAVLTGAGAFAAMVAAFWVWWPAGVALGLAVGVLVVVRLGQRMHAAAQDVPVSEGLQVDEDELWQEFRRLRVRLGDDWARFRAAAVVVTRAQSASAAMLRRELGVSTPDAQHLLQLLEREGFVGPARGTQPRQVRVARDHAVQLEDLLEA